MKPLLCSIQKRATVRYVGDACEAELAISWELRELSTVCVVGWDTQIGEDRQLTPFNAKDFESQGGHVEHFNEKTRCKCPVLEPILKTLRWTTSSRSSP